MSVALAFMSEQRRPGDRGAATAGQRRGRRCGGVAAAAMGPPGTVATRISGLAPPGAVVVSDAVETLIRNDFELEACPPGAVNGAAEPINHYRVVAERARVAGILPDAMPHPAACHSWRDVDDVRIDR